MCEKHVLGPIPRTQHRPICVTVHPVIVPQPTPSRRRFNLRKAKWDDFSTDFDEAIEEVEPHQTDTACSWLVCHSRGGDCRGEHCANCIHLPRLSGGPAAQFFGEASRASPQHGWRSAYCLRETFSPTQDQNQH